MRSVRLLACEFTVTGDCEHLSARLDSLIQRATQRYAVGRSYHLDVWREGGGYRLRESEAGPVQSLHPDPRLAAETLVWRMQELALDALPEFTRVHAGCASWAGRRFLAAGPALSGKSTLIARLLFEGFAVHSDDLVLLRRGEVVPFPRRLWIRPPTLGLIPQLAALVPGCGPATSTGSLPLDPSEHGFDWHIEVGPVDAVFLLEPNRGGPTSLEACLKVVMAERIMSLSSLPAGGARDWIDDICAMVERADCYVLRCGGLDAMVLEVKGALQREPRSTGRTRGRARSEA